MQKDAFHKPFTQDQAKHDQIHFYFMLFNSEEMKVEFIDLLQDFNKKMDAKYCEKMLQVPCSRPSTLELKKHRALIGLYQLHQSAGLLEDGWH